MTTLTISLGQMDVKQGDPQANLAQVCLLVAEAARRGSDVLVLPELWSTGYDLERAAEYASRVNEGIFAETAVLAREYGIHIVGSNLSVLGEGEYGNTAVFHGPSGAPIGVYNKVHLFGLMDEDKFLTAGNSCTLIETAWGKIGLAICYDLRFPELFRTYALDGAKIIFLLAEWPYPRLAHWRTLLRARAIENQLFVVACNRVGQSSKTVFFGHSCIIDPWGETVIEAGDAEQLLTVQLDLKKVDAVRETIPVFSDRNAQAYHLEDRDFGISAEGKSI